MADQATTGEIQELLEEGLRLYGAGQPARALELWYRILDREPRHPTALEYVQYVRDNFHVDVPEPRVGLPASPAPAPAPVASPVSGAEPDVVEVAASSLMPPPTPPAAPIAQPHFAAVSAVGEVVASASVPTPVPSPSPAPAPAPPTVDAAAPSAVSASADVVTLVPTAPVEGLNTRPEDPVGAGWGDLAVGDLDLDPLTGRPVQRAPTMSSAPRAPTSTTAAPAPVETRVEAPESPAQASAPPSLSLEPPSDAVVQQEASLDAPSLVEVPPVAAGAPGEVANPWDGHSGITEAVDLDAPSDQPSAMDLLLAGPVRRPHVENGLRGAAVEGAPEQEAAPEKPDEAQSELGSLMEGARDLFELGDFSGSLELVEKVLRQDPNNAEALAYFARNEATLLKMYESKLGDLSASPRVLTSPDEVIWMNLHHRAGFVLSQVDGELSYEDIVAVSGMSRFETFRILAELIENGVIG